MINWKNKR